MARPPTPQGYDKSWLPSAQIVLTKYVRLSYLERASRGPIRLTLAAQPVW